MIAELPQVADFPRLVSLINERLRDLDRSIQEPKFSGDLDMGGNRIVNLGSPRSGTEAARFSDVGRRTIVKEESITDPSAKILTGTHAERLGRTASLYKPGTLFFESDRSSVYVSTGGNWYWTLGAMYGSLAPDTKPADLGPNDYGFTFYAIDYFHAFVWNGTGWQFHFMDEGSGQISAAGVVAPQGGLWGLCDGSSYSVANANGTLTSRSTPDLTGGIFVMGGSYTGSSVAAARAKWETTAKTDAESAHTHSVDLPSKTSSGNDGTMVVQSGTGATVPNNPHGHTVDPDSATSAAGSAHQHALSDATAQLKAPSEANGGLPIRIALAWYMRR